MLYRSDGPANSPPLGARGAARKRSHKRGRLRDCVAVASTLVVTAGDGVRQGRAQAPAHGSRRRRSGLGDRRGAAPAAPGARRRRRCTGPPDRRRAGCTGVAEIRSSDVPGASPVRQPNRRRGRVDSGAFTVAVTRSPAQREGCPSPSGRTGRRSRRRCVVGPFAGGDGGGACPDARGRPDDRVPIVVRNGLPGVRCVRQSVDVMLRHGFGDEAGEIDRSYQLRQHGRRAGCVEVTFHLRGPVGRIHDDRRLG